MVKTYEEKLTYETEFMNENFPSWGCDRTAGSLWAIYGDVVLSNEVSVYVTFTAEDEGLCFLTSNLANTGYLNASEITAMGSAYEDYSLDNEVALAEVFEGTVMVNASLLSEEDSWLVMKKFILFLEMIKD
jgi:hypothetical protein